jgi:hypothetical protein
MNLQTILSALTLLFATASLLSLGALHFASPEFQPSWRMISEYAMGKHHWLITSFFIFWGLSSFTLCILLWPNVTGLWATIGIILLAISGVGEIMGGLFDINHKLHGLSFMLGVPSLPIAALLIGYHLINKDGSNIVILLSSHATWISVILMAVAMVVMMTGFKNAGIPMGPGATPPDSVPDGVIALAGYANRFLVITYLGWLLIVANYLNNSKL